MLSRIKLLTVLILSFSLFSCGEFIGFDDFTDPDVGNVKKIKVYFSEENMERFYDSVSPPEEDHTPCRITVNNGVNVEGTMRVRGNTSRRYPKKNFTLRIKEGMHEGNYALMHEDFTWLKNRIVMYAYNNFMYKGEALVPAPETEAVALYINDKYIGYYAKVDMYSQEQLEAWKSGFMSELFKVELLGYEENPLRSNSERKFPDNDDFSSLETLIVNTNYMSDAQWNEWVESHIDVDNFIRYMVVHDFFAVGDTANWNYYLYNYGKMVFLPWDNELGMELNSGRIYGDGKIQRRILTVPSVRTAYKQAMTDLADDTAFLNELKAQVDKWYDEAFLAVKNDPSYRYTEKDFTNMKNYIKYFISNRGDIVKGLL